MGAREIFVEAAMLVLNFEGSLGVCQGDKALKKERKKNNNIVYTEIHKSLELVEMGILMGANKGNAMENKHVKEGTCKSLPWPLHSSALSTLSSPLSCTGFLLMNDREQFWIATGLMAYGRTIRPDKISANSPTLCVII